MADEKKENEFSEKDFQDTKFLNSLLKGVRNIYLLWLIGKKRMHGYAIISKINETSTYVGNKKVVHGSTIYPLLHSLENDGLITSVEEYNGNHKVKVYEITEKGVFTLNSIKTFIKSRPDDDTQINFIDEMIFNDKVFTKN